MLFGFLTPLFPFQFASNIGDSGLQKDSYEVIASQNELKGECKMSRFLFQNSLVNQR
jgi:hypothetical protein